jgi:hypothetical protein
MKWEQKILEMLKENPEEFVSGEDVSGRCGLWVCNRISYRYGCRQVPF